MDVSINIGRTIARERRRAGVTQEALARHLGVTKAAVSKWELAQCAPDVSLLPRIASYFSLTLDELFDWRDELTEEESAALYAEVYALGERDLSAAHERLRALAAEHYSDASLMLMLASLLTTWACGVKVSPTVEQDGADRGMSAGAAERTSSAPADGAAFTGEALHLIDRVLEIATDPSILYLARQQKATVLFQTGRYDDAAALLEPLVKRQDGGSAIGLLAAAYRELSRTADAQELLQTERLRAASFVLSSLVQEVGTRDDAAFARAAGRAAKSIFDALEMNLFNPLYPAVMALEVADALRRAGDRENSLKALDDAVAAVAAGKPTSSGAPNPPLWDHVTDRVEPSRFGTAWAEHKAHQADLTTSLTRRAVAERATSPAWRAFAGDDAHYLEIVAKVNRLAQEAQTADDEWHP